MDRLKELDALRGIAALGVVLYHLTSKYDYLYGHAITGLFPHYPDNPGRYGVELFFMISGFVIFLTLNKTEKVKDFIVSRFSRLFPVYWASILVTVLFVSLFPMDDLLGQIQPDVILVNLSMLQSLIWYRHVDPSYWSLGFELMFYFLMAIQLGRNKIHQIDRFCVIWLSFEALLTGLFIVSQSKIVVTLTPIFASLPWAHLFIAGIMFYKIKSGSANKFHYVILACCLALHWILMGMHTARFNLLSSVLTTLFFVVFFLFAKNKLKFLAIAPLVYLGTISYSLYLVHQIAGYSLMSYLYQMTGNTYVVIGLAIVNSLVLATLLTYLVEKPSMRVIKRWYSNRQEQRLENSSSKPVIESD